MVSHKSQRTASEEGKCIHQHGGFAGAMKLRRLAKVTGWQLPVDLNGPGT